MNSRSLRISVALFVALLGLGFIPAARAADVEMTVPAGHLNHKIGKGALDDPSGVSHTRQDIAGKVVVVIFSAPNMSQGDAQKKWSDLLADRPDSKLSDQVVLALIEDMSQAGIFKGIARADMKKEFVKGGRPLVILDETGVIFQKFGVPRNKTEILIYDKTSTLRDVEQNLDDESTTVRRIHDITELLRKQ